MIFDVILIVALAKFTPITAGWIVALSIVAGVRVLLRLIKNL